MNKIDDIFFFAETTKEIKHNNIHIHKGEQLYVLQLLPDDLIIAEYGIDDQILLKPDEYEPII